MTDLPLINHPDKATPEWMTDALRAAGVLPTGRVVAVDSTKVGTGQVGDSHRFQLTYEGGSGPASVIGKFPSGDDTSREGAKATRTYEVETSFYRELRHRVGIRTPAPYLSMYELASNDFVLLLEDMAPARQGDQIAGCDADTAAVAIDEIGRLHAPVWGASDLAGLGWLNRSTPDSVAFASVLFGSLWPGFLERYTDRVDPEVLEFGHAFFPDLGTHLTYRPEPHTAAHGDYRLDNMLFGLGEGSPLLTTVDWQTVALGPGVSDVAYFMGTSPLPEVRASIERDLVSQYHASLVLGGVSGFDLDECWYQYRRFAYAGFLMAVGASMFVGRTDRGDEMFMCMANRSGRMAIELDTLKLAAG